MVRSFARLMVLLAVGLALFSSAAGQSQLRVRCHWWPPTTGSTPLRYYLQIQDPRTPSTFDTVYVVPHQGGAISVEQEFIFLDGEYWEHYRARVQAEDTQGRLGPWTDWSLTVVFEVGDPEP